MNLTIELPDDLSADLHLSRDEMKEDLRLALAIDWYRRGMLSEEGAAHAAGLTRERLRDEMTNREAGRASVPRPVPLPADDEDQIAERLSWTPRERLQYLLDMLDFEERAHRARPVARVE